MSSPDRAPEVASELGSLDALLEHRSRLAACVLLSKQDQLSFSRLRDLLDESDGNLGAQLRKLEDAGYISAHKEFVDRRPVTWYRLATRGRKALRAHLDAMASVIAHARA